MAPVCIAFKAHQGWINAVGVDARSSVPLPILVERIELAASEDRKVSEPYHVAGGWQGLKQMPRPKDPAAVVRQGRAAQVRSAKKQLGIFHKQLNANGWRWLRAVVLVGRGRLGNDLERILGAHSKIHVAEGEAVRDAARSAFSSLGIQYVDQDEKDILSSVGARLKLADHLCDDEMKPLKPLGVKAWRTEERLLAFAAWLNRT